MNETQVYRGNERLGLLDSGDEIGDVVGGRGPSSVPSHTKQAAARLVDGGVLTPEKAERRPSLLFIHPRASLLIFLARRRQYPGMIWSLLCSLLSAFKTRRSLALENLALRQQLAVQKRSVKRTAVVECGPWFLGAVAKILDRLGQGPHHREARDRCPVAPLRVQTLLDMEEPEAPAGSTRRRSRTTRADP